MHSCEWIRDVTISAFSFLSMVPPAHFREISLLRLRGQNFLWVQIHLALDAVVSLQGKFDGGHIVLVILFG